VKHDEGNGMIGNALKVGNYIYHDRYGEFNGNRKILLSDYSHSAMGAPPATTNDLVPMFSDGTYIWHGELGCGGRINDQQIYKYGISGEGWTVLPANNYPGNDDLVGNWGALHFPNENKAIWWRGSTRYYNTPSHVWIYDPTLELFTDITRIEDGLWNAPNVLDTAAMATPTIMPARLSHDNLGMGGNSIDDDGDHCGVRPVGFTHNNHYRFMFAPCYRYNDGAEKGYPVLVLGDLRRW